MGCGKTFHLKTEERQADSPWPFHHGDLQAQNAIRGHGYNGRLDVIWEQDTKSKAAGPLTIYHNLLIHPGAKDRLKFYGLSDGKYRGQYKAKGTPQTGVTVQDTLGFFAVAPTRNKCYAIDLKRAARLWDRPLRDAVNGTILYKERLLVGSRDGTVIAVDPAQGEADWRTRLEGRLTTPPAIADGRIWVATDNARLVAIEPDSGKEVLRVDLTTTVVAPLAVDELLYAGDVAGNLHGIEPADGTIVWTVQLDGSLWASPAISEAHGVVVVGHKGGHLVALDALNGDIRWRHDAVQVISAPPLVVGDYVVFGTLGGRLVSVDIRTGEPVQERQLDGAIAVGPVSDGQRIFVATQEGHLLALGERDDTQLSEVGQ